MKKFQIGKSYYVKKDNAYLLVFNCNGYDGKNARFFLTDIQADADIGSCPTLFSMLQDYYTHFNGNLLPIYQTTSIEGGEEREVVFSNYENYLRIDSANEYIDK